MFHSLRNKISLSAHSKRSSIPLFIILTALTGIGLAAILQFSSHSDQQPSMQQQLSHLHTERSILQDKLTEAEALLSLKNAQIKSMQQQLQADKTDMHRMQKRLDLFDQVLAERKLAGIHFLKPSAAWRDKHSIAYRLILVKGNNYPRWIKGHLAFRIMDQQGHSSLLTPIKKAKTGFKVEMTEQAFIEGILHCPQAWRPNMLRITLINHLGRNKGSIDIPIKPLKTKQATAPQPETGQPL